MDLTLAETDLRSGSVMFTSEPSSVVISLVDICLV